MQVRLPRGRAYLRAFLSQTTKQGVVTRTGGGQSAWENPARYMYLE